MKDTPSPFAIPTRLAHAERLHVRGVDYCIRRSGPADGPPLFLLHGLLDTGESYAPLTHFLDDGWQIIAPDWRGHGDSEFCARGYWFPDYVADLDVITRHYAGKQAVPIVAHSMGCSVATLFAGLRPERVAALVCLDGLNIPSREADRVPARYRRWLDTVDKDLMPVTYDSEQALAARVRSRYPELDDRRIDLLSHIWGRRQGDRVRLACDPRHLLPMPISYDAEATLAIWREITAPVFCIDGGRSPARDMISREAEQRRRAVFSRYQKSELEGLGHFLQLEAPETVGPLINDFLADSGPWR